MEIIKKDNNQSRKENKSKNEANEWLENIEKYHSDKPRTLAEAEFYPENYANMLDANSIKKAGV